MEIAKILKKKSGRALLIFAFLLAVSGGVVWWTVREGEKGPFSLPAPAPTPQNNPSSSEIDFSSLKHQYTLDDFPKAKNEEGSEELLERLNKEYVALQEGDNLYGHWIEIGILKKALYDYKGAEEAWRNAASLVNHPTIAYGNLADLYFHFLRNYSKAEEYYKLALELNPNSYLYREGLADLYRYNLTSKKDEVEKIMAEGVQRDKSHQISYYAYLVEFFKEQKNKAKVKEYVDKIKKIDPHWTPYSDAQEIEVE